MAMRRHDEGVTGYRLLDLGRELGKRSVIMKPPHNNLYIYIVYQIFPSRLDVYNCLCLDVPIRQ